MILSVRLTLWHISTIRSSFSSQLITSNFPSILTVFHRFFTCIATDDRHLSFSLMLVWKANAVEDKLHDPCDYITNIINPHMTDGVAVAPLSVSLPQMISVAPKHVFQIALNQKLSHKLKKWCKFLSHITAKSREKRSHIKWDLPVLWMNCSHWFYYTSDCCYPAGSISKTVVLPWFWDPTLLLSKCLTQYLAQNLDTESYDLP